MGGGYIVPYKNIIVILDKKKAEGNEDTGLFLEKIMTKAEKVMIKGETRSIIVSENRGVWVVFYSPISTGTLLKRGRKKGRA